MILFFNTPTFFKFKNLISKWLNSDTWYLLKFFIIILILDALMLDDEPLWEPIEWSVVQTWILFIYLFSWVAEATFSARYGSFSNRDKVVWIGLFKTYWLTLVWFFINLVIITVFVTLPFYFEITYAISYSVVWWNWISSVFFFKIISIFATLTLITQILRFLARQHKLNTIKFLVLALLLVVTIFFFFFFISTWFAFFTDPNTFLNSGWSEFSTITNGPLKWGWGLESRDHFAYHKTTTVFWAKNDQLILSSFLFFNIFIFLYTLFFLIQLFALYRILVTTSELSHNLINYMFSTTRYFFFIITYLFILVILSLIYQIIRFPFEIAFFGKSGIFTEVIYDLIYDFILLLFSFFV